MGIKQSCPLKRRPIYFESPVNYTSFGTRREEELAPTHTKLFHKIHEQFWDELMKERRKDIIAKNKLFDVDQETMKKLTERFTKFTLADIETLRYHFQCIDFNGDGLIDKHELTSILKSYGEATDMHLLEQCFQVIDEDESGAIDFEEFLGLIYRLRYNGDDKNTSDMMRIMYNVFEEEMTRKIKKLPVRLQIKNDLF